MNSQAKFEKNMLLSRLSIPTKNMTYRTLKEFVKFICESLYFQKAAYVTKILETVLQYLAFIFKVLSGSRVGFVLLVLAIKNIVRFIKTRFYGKRRCVTMHSYVQMFSIMTGIT